MRSLAAGAVLVLASIAAPGADGPRAMPAAEQRLLLETRERIWRALFAFDRTQLAWMLPEGSRALGPGNSWNAKFSDRAKLMQELEQFPKNGGKLIDLQFPRTDVQSFGNMAILYTEFTWELESGGKRTRQHGFATEVFHKSKGRWTNPGWHLEIVRDGER